MERWNNTYMGMSNSEEFELAKRAVEVGSELGAFAQRAHAEVRRLTEENALLELNNSTLNDMIDNEQKHYVVMREHFESEIARLKVENDQATDIVAELFCEVIGLREENEKLNHDNLELFLLSLEVED